MKGLADTEVTGFNVPGDGPGHLNVSINTTIVNPSFVSMHVGDVYFDVLYQNWTIGSLMAPNLFLKSGMHLVLCDWDEVFISIQEPINSPCQVLSNQLATILFLQFQSFLANTLVVLTL